jgi:hypothetical protein
MHHADSSSGQVRLQAHTALAPLLELSERTGFRFGFIADPPPLKWKWYDLIPIRLVRQFCHLQTGHLRMAWAILRVPRPDVFFLFTINPIYSLPIYFTLLLRGRPAFFIVHGSQQTAARSLLHQTALQICRFAVRVAELYPVHLELGDAGMPAGVRFIPEKSLCIPHPHPLAEKPLPEKKREGPLRVGVVGILRGDKPIDEIFRLLAGMQDELGLRLVLGTPLWQKPDWADSLAIEIIDTMTEAQYFACLAGLDVLVVDFRRADYYFRPSGVIIDAAMCGVTIVCPDFPVLVAEITNPVAIGRTYSGLDEIPGLLREMKEVLRAASPDFVAWREPRRMEKIAPLFRRFLESRGVRPSAQT